MRISDWSSDVCSSDLLRAIGKQQLHTVKEAQLCSKHQGCRAFIIRNVRPCALSQQEIDPHGVATCNYDMKCGLAGGAVPCIDVGARFAIEVDNLFARSDERRVGKVCLSSCKSRLQPY